MIDPLARAIERHRRGDLDGAEHDYRAVLEADPARARAHHWLGLLLHARRRDGEALAALERAAVLDPGSADTLSALAMVLSACGDRASAVHACETALAIDPECASARLQLASLARDEGRLDAAVTHYAYAARALPQHADTHHNLGVLLARLGRADEAIASYRLARAADPRHRGATTNLANLLHTSGACDEALALYRALRTIDPENGLAAHMIDALSGARATRCPRDFVASLFDDCADTFDEHLRDRLGYTTPEHLVELVVATVPERDRPFRAVLDLGCGTGLAGRAIRPFCGHLVGIDLSPRMIEHAARSGLYDALHVGDVEQAASLVELDWDLAIAADAAPYTGDLAPWLRALGHPSRTCTRWVALSVEVPTRATDDWLLSSSGRFAHDPRYVRRVATDHGFSVRATTRAPLRREGDSVVEGDLWVLALPASPV